jgi:predicted small metal-binding protein
MKETKNKHDMMRMRDDDMENIKSTILMGRREQ